MLLIHIFVGKRFADDTVSMFDGDEFNSESDRDQECNVIVRM